MSSKAGIGIAITTYNRREQLLKLVTSLRARTHSRVPVVVFDDGGSDGSREAVAPLVSAYIQAENRGITVNKNRALDYFCKIRPAKRVLILEDDLVVTEPGWLKAWKRAIDHHGHINLALPQWSKSGREFQGGRGTPKHPECWRKVSGCAMGARIRLVKRSIGYLNPRFSGYGYEHAEWTERWIAAGYGGAITPRGRVYFALSRGLTLQPAQSSAAAEQIASNREVFLALREAGYPRAQRPWLTPETRRDFLQPFRQLASGAPSHGR
ncbi:MAG: glycosyltransferase [Cyanobacteriota bacterium]